MARVAGIASPDAGWSIEFRSNMFGTDWYRSPVWACLRVLHICAELLEVVFGYGYSQG